MLPGTFYVIPRSRPDSVGGGGGSGRIIFPVNPGHDQSDSPNSGTFFLHLRLKECININLLQKKTLTKSFFGGGGHGPHAYATVSLSCKDSKLSELHRFVLI